MSVVTYEGRVEQGQVRLKDAPVLPEGARVYVVIPEVEGTAFDPSPAQIAADARAALADFSVGRVVEIENAEDLFRLTDEPDNKRRLSSAVLPGG